MSITYLIIMAIFILCSAFFSATETAYSTLNRTRLKTMAEKGNKRAALALQLEENYDKLLSTILIGNNIVNIGTASLGTIMFVKLLGEDIGATVSTAVVTILVLIFGEISPKSLAKEHAEQFAMFSAHILKGLMWLFTPLNFLFTQWKKLLSRLFRAQQDPGMTQDELLMLVEEVKQDGSIDEDESNLLRSAIAFTNRTAEDILTHRVDLEAVPLTATHTEIAQVFTTSRYSRLLVYEENIDNIVGVLHQKDFYVGSGITEKPLKEIMTTPLFIPKSVLISDLLKLLQQTKSHIAVVTDEYGGTLGIVTMEDILEELVGEIWDEHDEVVEDFQKLDDHTYRISCTVSLEKLYQFFQIHAEVPGTSISGWVMEELGRIPVVGDSFQADGLDVTVSATDNHRILTIDVKPLPQTEPEE